MKDIPVRLVFSRRRKPLLEWQQEVERVARRNGLTLNEIMSRNRAHRISRVRWQAFKVLRERKWSMPQIARQWGIHHTTVLHGLRQLERANDS